MEKTPGISETLDWARAMVVLHHDRLDRAAVERSLGALIKDADDLERFRTEGIDAILQKLQITPSPLTIGRSPSASQVQIAE